MPSTNKNQAKPQAQTTEESKVEAPKKKKIKILKVKNAALYRVGFDGGGVLPKELQGSWTGPILAQAAIDNYESKRA